jgi:hypothetical protein
LASLIRPAANFISTFRARSMCALGLALTASLGHAQGDVSAEDASDTPMREGISATASAGGSLETEAIAPQAQDIDPDDVGMDNLEEDALPSWIDRQHAIATNRAQALAQWTDSFFGAPVQDAERADTFVRVIVADEWDRKDGHDFRARLRGQVNLPAISKRMDLVFAGAEAEDDVAVNEPSRSETAGLRLNVTDNKRVRFDATLSASSGPALVPGVRFRYQDAITDNSWYRFRQRYQYNTDRGHILISDLGLNRYMGEGSLLRWNGRLRYRDDRETWDWSQRIPFRQWLEDHERFPGAVEYYVSWGGNDDPEFRTADFRFGFLFRRQWLRPFLYYEIEPNYALRQDEIEEKRKWYPGITLRLEVMLDDDLVR